MPQPFAPTTAAICPARTVSVASRSTVRRPYRLVMPAACSRTGPGRGPGAVPMLSTTAPAYCSGWAEDDPGVAAALAQVRGGLGDHVPRGVRRDPALVQLGRERTQPIVGVHRVTPFVTMSFTGRTKVSQALPPARSAAYPSSVSR